MGFFGNKNEGGMLDVIRCDEEQYLIWKWRPNNVGASTRKENSIRWGSSLRVKDGEVAVFVYKQESGPSQDYIEGPFDETIKTANFPVISNIIGLAYAGQSPFQAEIYFINLAGNIPIIFGTPWFDVFDPRFADFPVNVAARGSLTFNIVDYKAFVKLHRLINFDIQQFCDGVADAVRKYIKGIITNVPSDNGIPVLQLERKLLEINDLITPRIKKAFEEDFGVSLKRFDLSEIEINKDTPEYDQLRAVTADLQTATLEAQTRINITNLEQTQAINSENMSETLRLQREQAERFAKLQTEQQFIAAHQVDKQADVLMTAATGLGNMGNMNMGGGGGGGSGGSGGDGSGGGDGSIHHHHHHGGGGGGGGSVGSGFNPIGMMTGLAVGGAMGGQMANMMNTMGQNTQAQMAAPPPLPQIQYNVSINGQNTGPFNLAQLQDMVRNGQLSTTTHVWKPGMANWEIAGNVPELAPIFAAAAPPPPPPPFSPPPPPTA
jgi:membrane protease subunit (stomatin/prohibitin family)